jgi:outer membrane protein assembly factor BamE (lipoprotein component of BamABCDE complex)
MKKPQTTIKLSTIQWLTDHMLFFVVIGLFFSSACLMGCAHLGTAIQSGDSPETVRTQLGEPTLKLALNDGSTAWYYTTGPVGLRTTKVIFNAQQKATLVNQTLRDDSFNQIQARTWNEDQVLALLGPPTKKIEFNRSQTIAWDYRYQDDWGYLSEYSIVFNQQGFVVNKAQQRIDRKHDSIGGP